MQESLPQINDLRCLESSASPKVLCDAGVFLGLFVLLLAVKFATLSLPYHWDEAVAYVRPALALLDGGLAHSLAGFRPGVEFFGHPPFLYMTLALTMHLFGASLVVAHAYVLAWSLLTLFYTYLLGKHLVSREMGFHAALLLLAMPLFFAQAGMVLGDVPLVALGLMTLYYALRRQHVLAVVIACLAVLTKETAVAFPIALVVYFLCQPASRRVAFAYLIPVVLLGGFFLWQRVATGQWIANPYFTSHPHGADSLASILYQGQWTLKWTLVSQYRVLLTFIVILALLREPRRFLRREFALFALVASLFLVAFFAIFFMRRYVLAVLPLLALVGAFALPSLVPSRIGRWFVVLLVAFVFTFEMHPDETGYRSLDYDMQYTDMIRIHHDACDYIQRHHPDARIAASVPMTFYLTEPRLGYVSTPLTLGDPAGDWDLLVYADNPDLYGPAFRCEINEPAVTLDRIFAYNGKQLSLYRRRPPETDNQ